MVIFLFPTIVVYCTDVNNQLEDFSIVVLCTLQSTVTSSNYFISWTISFSIYYKFKTYLWSIYFKIPQSVVICSVLLTVLYLIPNNLRINMVKVILQKNSEIQQIWKVGRNKHAPPCDPFGAHIEAQSGAHLKSYLSWHIWS